MLVLAESGLGYSTPWTALDRVHSSVLILLTLVGLGVLAYLLYRVGLLGAVLRVVGTAVRGSVRVGFRAWERLFAWATWPVRW